MGTTLDALNTATSSLTQRRQAASNLPAFELPPPPISFAPGPLQKFPPIPGINTSHAGPTPVSVGQLLTPPSNSASESASSSAIPTGTTPNSGAAPVLPYAPSFFGGGTGTTPNAYHTGYTPQPWQANGPLLPPRSMFSPIPGQSLRSGTHSPAAAEGSALPPPPYDLNPPYGAHLPLSSPGSASHPANAHHLMPSMQRPPSQHSPITPNDNKPALFGSMTTAGQHQPSYVYSHPTGVSQAPRISPTLQQGSLPSHSQPSFMRPPPPSYSLPAMPGPIMSNIHSPGTHMSMVGSMQANMLPLAFNSGYAANPQGMYGQPRTNTPQQSPANDRPFKCDQCPQSFNRNHDLKRHKRIHLAVKPFPCKYCDKSFSRKDALKRHILVKGCGSGSSAEAESKDDGPKSESGSDGVNDSPTAATAA
ncbi:uncharacterized protein PV06_02785 [Exophiala oligosperma]|uniref:C2H2-type domain-containing protein n=2 Tax=Chaetothyriales TaxID=34395 RepID=A0A0D2DX14_9EURO|nr:uncharacterized protein PV06_02785 [Exophiala oligosperma]KAJ9632815.1 hypothetical protein H2204_007690 [Knufia peltigerae]KIW47190.1 hypothetical protein PV06_02785 [Exophiala oligosperma]